MVVAEVRESGRHAPYVYVVAVDQARGHSWANSNRPDCIPRVMSPFTGQPTKGLWIPDATVYVLDDMPQDVREAWAKTGAKLVWI